MNDLIQILQDLMQEDYELWIRTSGYSHLSEEQWEWLIEQVKYKVGDKNEYMVYVRSPFYAQQGFYL